MYLIFINNKIICDRASKEIILLKKSPGYFTVLWKKLSNLFMYNLKKSK